MVCLAELSELSLPFCEVSVVDGGIRMDESAT